MQPDIFDPFSRRINLVLHSPLILWGVNTEIQRWAPGEPEAGRSVHARGGFWGRVSCGGAIGSVFVLFEGVFFLVYTVYQTHPPLISGLDNRIVGTTVMLAAAAVRIICICSFIACRP